MQVPARTQRIVAKLCLLLVLVGSLVGCMRVPTVSTEPMRQTQAYPPLLSVPHTLQPINPVTSASAYTQITTPPPHAPTTDPDQIVAILWDTGTLPSNYLTKDEAYALGWNPEDGNLWAVAGDGTAIGGDRFGNREGLLPHQRGRQWYEADVNYDGGYRGPERIVWSSDGLIFYTDDHYASFDLLFDPATDDAPERLKELHP